MNRAILSGALAVFLCFPSYAGFQVQRLLQMPAQPGQLILDFKADSKGNLIVAAVVTPPTIIPPLVSGQPFAGPSSSYGSIIKIDPNGNEIFTRFLPGAGPGLGSLILAIDNQDDIYVTGETFTPEAFPVTSALVASPAGPAPSALFAAKFRGQNGTLAYSAILNYQLEGLGCCGPLAIAVDGGGQALVALSGLASGLATTPGAYSSGVGPGEQTFLVRLSSLGDRIISVARYGGHTPSCRPGGDCSAREALTEAHQLAFDVQGNIWVAGRTTAVDLPVTPDGLKTTCGCSEAAGDGFLMKLSGDGSRLLYATYIGTTPADALDSKGDDSLSAMALDGSGRIWMLGDTNGTDLQVTPNATQKQPAAGFIVEYDPAANHFLYVSYLFDSAARIQIGRDGSPIIAGHSNSGQLPATATGFTRGGDYIVAIDSKTYAISALTNLPTGSAALGPALLPDGSVAVSAQTNVATTLKQTNGDATPNLYAVANSAGPATTGQISPGEIVSLYGANIGPATPVIADLSSGQAPTQLGGVQVLVDGTPAPLLYAQRDQINAIVPFGVSRKLLYSDEQANPPAHLVVTNALASSNEAVLGVISADPEAFKTTSSFAAALNQDGTMNTESNPASLGSIVSVFATGLGNITQPLEDGSIISGPQPGPAGTVRVVYFPAAIAPCGIGCPGPPPPQYLEVTYAGAAPTLVAGVMQVNIRLPPSATIAPPNFAALTLQFVVNGWAGSSFFVWVK